MSDGSDTNAFGKWTPIVAIIAAIGSGVFNLVDSNKGDKGGQEFTHLNAEATFGVIGIVREDLQRQIDQQREEIDDLKAELDRLE